MRFGLLVILMLAVGAVAAHFLLQDNGYVLINFRGYAVEMSVPIMAFALLMFYLLMRLLVRIWRVPRDLGEAASRARDRRAGRRSNEAMIALSEGKLARGERLLTRAASGSATPLLNYLTAARAAQMQGDYQRRDSWLRMAYEQEAGAGNAVLLTQAELQLAEGAREQARASLQRVLENQPRHPEGLRLLAGLYCSESNWAELAELLPVLRKLPNLSNAQVELWTVQAISGLMADPRADRAAVEARWQSLPRAQRKQPELLRARIRALARVHALPEAEVEIRRALKGEWDAQLVDLYGSLELKDASRQLAHLESWLRERPEDPVLLLAAGRACIRNQLWGKARSYLESSLAVQPSPAAYQVLGQLMTKLGDGEAATAAFRRGLTMSYAGDESIPRLQADPRRQEAPEEAQTP